jgi:hypothetical protein
MMEYEIEGDEGEQFNPGLEAICVMVESGVLSPSDGVRRAYELGVETVFNTLNEIIEEEAVDQYAAEEEE